MHAGPLILLWATIQAARQAALPTGSRCALPSGSYSPLFNRAGTHDTDWGKRGQRLQAGRPGLGRQSSLVRLGKQEREEQVEEALHPAKHRAPPAHQGRQLPPARASRAARRAARCGGRQLRASLPCPCSAASSLRPLVQGRLVGGLVEVPPEQLPLRLLLLRQSGRGGAGRGGEGRTGWGGV